MAPDKPCSDAEPMGEARLSLDPVAADGPPSRGDGRDPGGVTWSSHGAEGACPFCGGMGGTVQVHGHGQCASCGTNIHPCCEGVPVLGQEPDPSIL